MINLKFRDILPPSVIDELEQLTINLTSEVVGTLPVSNGGLGLSTIDKGDILVASADDVLSAFPDVATGNALISGGVGELPSYGKIGIVSHIDTSAFTTGSIPFVNGSVLAQDNANLFWDSSNLRLGLGNATPQGTINIRNNIGRQLLLQRLDHGDTASTDGTYLQQGGSGEFNIVNQEAPSWIAFNAGGVELFRAYGDVGGIEGVLIGTATNPSVGSKFLIFGDGTAPATLGSNTAGIYAEDVSGTVKMFAIDEDGVTGQVAKLSGNLSTGSVVFKGSAGLLTEDPADFLWDTATDSLFVRGNIGVRVTATAPLHVKSNAGVIKFEPLTSTESMYGTFSSAGATVYFGTSSSTGTGLFTGATNYSGGIGTGNATNFHLATNNTVRLTIESDGDVGIGTTAPTGNFTKKLQVHDSTVGGSSELILSNGSKKFEIAVDNTSLRIYDDTASLNRIWLDTVGRLGLKTRTPQFQGICFSGINLGGDSYTTPPTLAWQYGPDATSRNWGIQVNTVAPDTFSILTSSTRTDGLLDVTLLYTDSSGTFGIGTTALPSTGTRGLVFADGTALAAMGTNTAGEYADDVGGTVELFGINEAGNVSQLTGLNIRKTADESVTNSTTHQADDHLTVNLAASSSYVFEFYGFWTTAGATAGITVQLDGTVGVSSLKADVTHYENSADTFTVNRITAFNSAVGFADTGDNSFMIKGVIETSTAGTLFLEWAQNTADAVNATTLQENSYLVLRKLNA